MAIIGTRGLTGVMMIPKPLITKYDYVYANGIINRLDVLSISKREHNPKITKRRLMSMSQTL
jgi:hypothetical protein